MRGTRVFVASLGLSFLTACGVFDKIDNSSKDDKDSEKTPTAADSDTPVTDSNTDTPVIDSNTDTPVIDAGIAPFVDGAQSGETVSWSGTCVNKPNITVVMQLVANNRYAASALGGHQESGRYRVSGKTILFYEDSGSFERMSCGKDGEFLSCTLAVGNKIAFFDDCSIVKFKRDATTQAAPDCNSSSHHEAHAEAHVVL